MICRTGSPPAQSLSRPDVKGSKRKLRAALVLTLLVMMIMSPRVYAAALRLDERTITEGPNTFTERTIVYEAAAGEANEATVSLPERQLLVTDSGATIFAGAPCKPIGPNAATCPLSRRINGIKVLAAISTTRSRQPTYRSIFVAVLVMTSSEVTLASTYS